MMTLIGQRHEVVIPLPRSKKASVGDYSDYATWSRMAHAVFENRTVSVFLGVDECSESHRTILRIIGYSPHDSNIEYVPRLRALLDVMNGGKDSTIEYRVKNTSDYEENLNWPPLAEPVPVIRNNE